MDAGQQFLSNISKKYNETVIKIQTYFGKIYDHFVDIFVQTYILLKKNTILHVRRWKTTLLQLLSPIAITVLLILLGLLIQSYNIHYPHPFPGQTPEKLIGCTGWNGKNCYVLAYATNNLQFAKDVMSELMVQHDLKNEDVLEFEYTKDLEDFLSLEANNNLTQSAIAFSNMTYVGSIIDYTIYYNNTGDVNYVIQNVQLAVDNVIAYLASDKTIDKVSIKAKWKGYPKPSKRTNGIIQLFQNSGAQFFSLSTMLIMINILYAIVSEKESRIRIGMQMMGLYNSSYWASWFITACVLSALQSLVTIVFGIIVNISFFTNTNFFVLFLMFFFYSLSLVSLAFIICALINTTRAALIVGFIVYAISYILNLFMTNGRIVYLLYSDDVSPVYRILFSFYPPFNFAKMFVDISLKSLEVYDIAKREYVSGPGYWWDDFAIENNGYNLTAPPTANSLYILWANIVGYAIIGWYLDNVITERRNLFFFLFPSYYGIHLFKNKKQPDEPLDETLDKDIQQEYHNARKEDENYIVRLVGLGKVYKSLFGKSLHAVKGLDLVIEKGTCLALLGHNGAGKTTTISMLVGLLPVTKGDAFVCGQSIRYDIQSIRRSLGVCPQHDILWDDLTAKEHLTFFAELKGMARKDIPKEVDDRLIDVDLLDVKYKLSKTFSGGMKRRLSVAIACIGSPSLVLLDEPTTGMDPHSKRKVWKLIESMKGTRAVLLTTHSMEEAEALSDRIAIMTKGRLQCVGDSLHLKHKYGAGYNLNIVINQNDIQTIKQLVTKYVPTAKIVNESAGNIIYNISPDCIKELGDLLEEIEKLTNKDGSSKDTIIKDWAISHTTLEEVYLKVTSHDFDDFKQEEAKELPEVVVQPATEEQTQVEMVQIEEEELLEISKDE